MTQEFLGAQPGNNGAASEDAHHTEAAKEMQRAREIAQQETDGQQIKEDTEGTGNPVVRNAAFAVDVADGHFANGGAMPGGQRGNEAVQFAIERNLLEDVAAVGL